MNHRQTAAFFFFLAWTGASRAGDSPQWGGVNLGRNLFSEEKGLPAVFNPGEYNAKTESFMQSKCKNLKWVARLGGMSLASPCVSGGKVFIGTNNDLPRDPGHEGDRSILLCLDEKTGDFLWQLVVPKLAAGKVNDWENLGLVSTPAVERDRVYIATSRCEVLCLTTEGLRAGNVGPFMDEAQYIAGPGKPRVEITTHDADIVWRYDMIEELGVFPHNATRSHVLATGGTLYVTTGNGIGWDHQTIPSPHSPSLVALDMRTGKLLAEDEAGVGRVIFHGQWSGPSTGRVADRDLIFYGGGDGFCYAFDAHPRAGEDGGVLDTVWKVDANPISYRHEIQGEIAKPRKYPDNPGPSEIISTPVFWRNRVYVAVGQDPEHGEGVGNLVCIDATITGNNARRRIVWNNTEIDRSLSTVAITPEGLLFVADFTGNVRCLDANTGHVHWKHDMKAHIWASTLVADSKVYIGDEDGDFVVLTATKEKKVLSEINLQAPIYTTAVAANGVLYVNSNMHLFAFKEDAPLGDSHE